MNGDLVRPVAVALAYAFVLVMNALATWLPLAGRETGDISELYPVPFTPAGYVFSVWAVIYAGLGAYVAFQLRPGQRDNPRLRAIAWPFVASCVLNGLWLVAWHHLLVPLSLLIMLGLLGALASIYERYRSAPGAPGAIERWTVRVPFSLYLGWITVATLANLAVAVWDAGWRPGTPVAALWTVGLVAAGLATGAAVWARRRDAAYVLVLAWAFVGIAVANRGLPLVAVAALAAAALLLALPARAAVARRATARS